MIDLMAPGKGGETMGRERQKEGKRKKRKDKEAEKVKSIGTSDSYRKKDKESVRDNMNQENRE